MAPAATNLSPVARDYPSRASGEPFQVAVLRLFYQGTTATWEVSRELKGIVLHKMFTGKMVNNLGISGGGGLRIWESRTQNPEFRIGDPESENLQRRGACPSEALPQAQSEGG